MNDHELLRIYNAAKSSGGGAGTVNPDKQKQSREAALKKARRIMEMWGFFDKEKHGQVIIERDDSGVITGTNNANLARGEVLRNLEAASVRDGFFSKEEAEFFFEKPLIEWPPSLQKRLMPFGANMIQQAEDPSAFFNASACGSKSPAKESTVMQPPSRYHGSMQAVLARQLSLHVLSRSGELHAPPLGSRNAGSNREDKSGETSISPTNAQPAYYHSINTNQTQ